MRAFLQGAERAGVAPDKLLKIAEIRSDELEAADARVPVAKVNALCDAMEDLLQDDVWLLRSSALRPGDFGLVEYIFRQCPSLGESYRSLEHYHHIVTARDVTVSVRGATIEVAFTAPHVRSQSLNRIGVQMWLYFLLEAGRRVTGESWRPIAVDIPVPAPQDASPYVALIGKAPRYDAEALRVTLPDEVLRLPVRDFDPALAGVLRQVGDDVLARYSPASSVIDLLRRAIVDHLRHGAPTVDQAARRLGMSRRSLQRKLQEEGLTFSSLTDELRHRLARLYLRELDVSIEEVAYLLGYAAPRGFYTAFQRWEAMSPSAFRGRFGKARRGREGEESGSRPMAMEPGPNGLPKPRLPSTPPREAVEVCERQASAQRLLWKETMN